MRCPSCGTDNTADSRFCGGCGAKTTPSRVAPTVKMSGDAPYPATAQAGYAETRARTDPGRTPIHIPTPPPGAINYGSIPPANVVRQPSHPGTESTRSPSIPPTQSGPQHSRNPSVPPTNQPISASRRPAPLASDPSMSMAAAPRRSPLIAIVVILDLGLAGAGAMLLAKGLAKGQHAPQDAAQPASPSTSAGSGSASAPPPDVAPGSASQPAKSGSAADLGTGSGAAAAAPGINASGLVADTRSKHHATKVVANPKTVTVEAIHANTADIPINTPPAASITNDVNARAASSSGVFKLCHNNAGDVHGRIQIAFEVEATGLVDHVAAVENTTGSDQLANCLINTIAAWTFPPHTGDKADFVRPFNYE